MAQKPPFHEGYIFISENIPDAATSIMREFPDFDRFNQVSDTEYQYKETDYYGTHTYTLEVHQNEHGGYTLDSCEYTYDKKPQDPYGIPVAGNEEFVGSKRIEFTYDPDGEILFTNIIDINVDGREDPYIAATYDDMGRVTEIIKGVDEEYFTSFTEFEYSENGVSIRGDVNWEISYDNSDSPTAVHTTISVDYDSDEKPFQTTVDTFSISDGKLIPVSTELTFTDRDNTVVETQRIEYSKADDGSWECTVTIETPDGVTIEEERIDAKDVPQFDVIDFPEDVRAHLTEIDRRIDNAEVPEGTDIEHLADNVKADGTDGTDGTDFNPETGVSSETVDTGVSSETVDTEVSDETDGTDGSGEWYDPDDDDGPADY